MNMFFGLRPSVLHDGRRVRVKASGSIDSAERSLVPGTSVRAVLLGSALALSPVVVSSSQATTPAFLLIDTAAVGSMPKLVGCKREMTALNDKLGQAHADSKLLEAPTTDELRRELLLFADRSASLPRVFIFCGYAASSGGQLFVLPADVPVQSDYGVRAVGAQALSRLASMTDGATVLDLHADGPFDDVKQAVATWQNDTTLRGGKLQIVEGDASQATLVAKLSRLANDPSALLAFVKHGTDALPALNDTTASLTGNATAAAPQPAPTSPQALAAQGAQSGGTAVSAAVRPPPPADQSVPPAGDGPQGFPLDQANSLPPASAAPNAQSQVDGSLPVPSTIASRPPPDAPVEPKRATLAGVSRPGSEAHRSRDTVSTAAQAGRPAGRANATIWHAQVALRARGLYIGRVDGIDTLKTRASIADFQAILGHPRSGQLTSGELNVLRGE